MKGKGEIYLGDGLYMSVPFDSVQLRASRESGDHFILMDGVVLREFFKRVIRLGTVESLVKSVLEEKANEDNNP